MPSVTTRSVLIHPPGFIIVPGQSVSASLLETVSGKPPAQGTRVTVSRSETHLEVFYACEDTLPWATRTGRNAPLYEEEVCELFIDPFGDLECYFEFEVNPLNTVLDLVVRRVGKGLRKDTEWNCEGLETTAAITPAGWRASMRIPFDSLAGAPPAPGAIWRANFYRIDRPAGTPRELSAWSPTFRDTFHVPARFGFLEFR
jgi:hypothetical protein